MGRRYFRVIPIAPAQAPGAAENATSCAGRVLAAHAGQAGIVDQVSFVVMRRLGITEAFTNDRHFQAAGFHTLF